ncbi:hypothetical protein RhiirB3_431103 [Rhizophagus irregularis]|nr:hypothetical protein RhiirB3_431103 [Rhizophagus irregularis]
MIESIIGKVDRTALIVDNVNLKETFEDYCNECDNIFDIEAFKVSYNILKSGEFEEISITYNFLEVPVESSKHQCNANINPIIDRVLKSKYADGLVYLWQSNKELVWIIRNVLNQRIILHLRDGILDNKDLMSFGAFDHHTEVSLF